MSRLRRFRRAIVIPSNRSAKQRAADRARAMAGRRDNVKRLRKAHR